MNDTNPPVQSMKTLVSASLFAVFFAAVILISAVLPAEYGIDPTGLGAKTGLTALAGASTSKPMVVSCPEIPSSLVGDEISNAAQAPRWKNSVMITVPPGDGLEYKFRIRKGDVLEYSWYTDGTKLYFDFHGEPKGDTTGYFKSYKEHTDRRSSGSLKAPFEGSHGWYWENRGRHPAIIALSTSGDYEVIGLK